MNWDEYDANNRRRWRREFWGGAVWVAIILVAFLVLIPLAGLLLGLML